MRDHDELARLRAADPVSAASLDRVDRGAWDALREGITMSAQEQRTARPRRALRRGVSAAGVAAVLLGGGAAYAVYEQWYVSDGAPSDGISCMPSWEGDVDGYGGPMLSGDPVADCRRYQELTGGEPIVDPVAFRANGIGTYVAPRGQVPDDAVLLAEPTDVDRAARELEASLRDWVDGLGSRCEDEAGTTAFVEAELARLGLVDWTLEVSPGASIIDGEALPCGAAYVERGRTAVLVLPNRAEDLDAVSADVRAESTLYQLRGTLRTEIAEQCLGVAEAETVARRAVGAEHHWPTTAVVDEDAACSRVDLEVGGSIQVTVYGPTEPRH